MPTRLPLAALPAALLFCGCGTVPLLHDSGSSTGAPRAAVATLAELDGTAPQQLRQPSAAAHGAADASTEASPRSETSEPEPAELVVAGLLERCDRARAIVVRKGARLLELRCGGQLAARHAVSLGFAPEGHKHHEGDGRTPEGTYYITSKYISQYHRSLQLSYPNVVDADRGLDEGQISQSQHAAIVRANQTCRLPPQNTALGSLLQIHGGGGGESYGDWTLGCVALENAAIEQAFAFQLPGCDADGPRTPVRVLP